MKILIVNVNAHEASTGKIAYGLYSYLKKKGDEVILCHRGVKEEPLDDPHIIRLSDKFQCYTTAFLSHLLGYEGIFSPLTTRKLISIIEDFKTDVVHLLNLPGYYVNHYYLLEYLKKKKIPTVYSMMDEFLYTAKCTYTLGCEKFMTECNHCPQKKAYPESWLFDFSRQQFNRKKKIYANFPELTITGVEWSCNMAKRSAISRDNKMEIIDHPINCDTLYTPRDTSALRKKYGILATNRVLLTAVPASVERKGGKYFLEIANRMKSIKDITFVFVGYDRNDWKIPENMITVGYVTSQDLLAEFYSLADLYVCTSIADTFPTTCLNSLACGTPVLGFIAGGVPYCAPADFGTFVEVGDVTSLIDIASATTKKTENSIKATREYACARYSEEVIYDKFYRIYHNYLEGKK